MLAARSDQAWLPSKSKGWCQSRQKNHACVPPNNKHNENHRIAGTMRSSLSHFSFHPALTSFSALAFENLDSSARSRPFPHKPVDTHSHHVGTEVACQRQRQFGSRFEHTQQRQVTCGAPSRRQTSSRDRGQGPGDSEISMREGRGRDCQRRRDGLLLEDAHLPVPGRTPVAKCDTFFLRTAAGDSSKSIDRAVKPATRYEGLEKQATLYANPLLLSLLPLRKTGPRTTDHGGLCFEKTSVVCF